MTSSTLAILHDPSQTVDPDKTLPSRLADNPMVWLIQVNGMIVDARHMPKEIQEEAFHLGMIPYLPSEQDEDNDDESEA